jgi:hypothetical protein
MVERRILPMKPVILTPELIVERIARVRAVQARAVASSLVRPAREAEKREALREIGGLGPFKESSTPRPTLRPARRS